MPFLDNDDPRVIKDATAITNLFVPPAARKSDPGFFDTALATFETHNLVTQWLTDDINQVGAFDPDYDPFELEDVHSQYDISSNPFKHLKGYEQFHNQFIGVNNSMALTRVKRDIDREMKNRRIMDEGTGTFGLSILAGIGDPLVFVPGAGVVKTASGAVNVLKTAAKVAGVGAGLVAVQEGLLHAGQETRTVEESAVAVGTGFILSGLLGGAAAKFQNVGARRTASRQLEAVLQNAPEVRIDTSALDTIDLAVANRYLSTRQLANQQGVIEIDPILGQRFFEMLSPRLQNAASKADPVREIADMLHQHNVTAKPGFVKSFDAETSVKLALINTDRVILSIDHMFIDHVTGGERTKANLIDRAIKFPKRPGKFTRDEFDSEIVDALRMGPDDYLRTGGDAHVAKAARTIKAKIIDPIGLQSVDAGYLTPSQLKKNSNYLTRLYDKDVLRTTDGRQAFIDLIVDHNLNKVVEQANGSTLRRGVSEGLEDFAADIRFAEPGAKKLPTQKQLVKEANEIVDDILGVGDGATGPSSSQLRGVWKQRTLDIPDSDLTPFLVNDLKRILKFYTRAATSDIELGIRFGVSRVKPQLDAARKQLANRIANADSRAEAFRILKEADKKSFGEFESPMLDEAVARWGKEVDKDFHTRGDKTIEKLLEFRDNRLVEDFTGGDMVLAIDRIRNHYDKLIDAAKKTDAKEVARLEKLKKRDLGNIELMRDDIRGLLNVPEDTTALTPRFLKGSRQLTYLALGGKIALSSIPDLALPIFNYGLGTVFRHAIAPMAKSWRATKLIGRELEEATGAAEFLLANRTMQMQEIQEEFLPKTTFGRGLEKATHLYSIANLSGPWNGFAQRYAALSLQGFLIESAEMMAKGSLKGAVKVKRLQRLGELGISEADASAIWKQFQKHAHAIDESQPGARKAFFPNTNAWDDANAKLLFKQAVLRSRDMNVLRGSVGDRPQIPGLSDEWSRTLYQFLNFGFAANTRILARGIQYKDATILSGILLTTGLGMFSTYLKRQLAGKDNLDLDELIGAGINQSGITGIVFDIDDIFAQASNGKVGMGISIDKALDVTTGGKVKLGLGGSRFYSGRGMTSAVFGVNAGRAMQALGIAAGSLDGLSEAEGKSLRRLAPIQNHFLLSRLFDSMIGD